MRRSARFAMPLTTAASALCLVGGCSRDGAPRAGPNVVLVTVDTLRADRLGAYGYFRNTTPVLDELAAESIVFERCLTPMATTYPSHLSLLTSTYPHETGAVANAGAGGAKFVPTPELRSFAQLLREHGYDTAGFVSAAPVKRFTGIAAGFDVFDEPEARTRSASATNDRASSWLESRGDAPVFLWVHYFEPHHPYEPPEAFARELPAADEDDALERYLRERDFRPLSAARELPVHVNHFYDGEVRTVDHAIGRLLDVLRTRPREWERTVLVVAGDHGEGLGQHAEREHGGVWNEQLHVPLMMRIPGVAPRRVGRLMSLADVLPTLMGLVELPGEDAFVRQASGVDRLAEAGTPPLILSQESAAPWRTRGGARRPRYVLTGTDWKLVHEPDGEELLFHLAADPYELRDVSAAHPDIAARLRAILLARVDAHKERLAQSKATPVEPSVDPETLEQLRALGYLDTR